MRRLSLLIALVALVALPLSATAAPAKKPMHMHTHAEGAAMTMQGEVVDAGCYMADGAKATGAGHKDCATKCFSKGMPAALLTPDGNMILLTPDHVNGAPYAMARTMPGEKVSVTGVMAKRGGMTSMSVTDVKKM